jgi:hypothetical protein
MDVNLSWQEAFELGLIELFLKLFPFCEVCINVDLSLIVLKEVIDRLGLSALIIVGELRLLVLKRDLGNHC